MLSPQHYPQAKTFILEISPARLLLHVQAAKSAECTTEEKRKNKLNEKESFRFRFWPTADCDLLFAVVVFDKSRGTNRKEIDFMRCLKRLYSRAEADFQLSIYVLMNIN
jgi:hypothetical protein